MRVYTGRERNHAANDRPTTGKTERLHCTALLAYKWTGLQERVRRCELCLPYFYNWHVPRYEQEEPRRPRFMRREASSYRMPWYSPSRLGVSNATLWICFSLVFVSLRAFDIWQLSKWSEGYNQNLGCQHAPRLYKLHRPKLSSCSHLLSRAEPLHITLVYGMCALWALRR